MSSRVAKPISGLQEQNLIDQGGLLSVQLAGAFIEAVLDGAGSRNYPRQPLFACYRFSIING